jgi:hypothetical protein
MRSIALTLLPLLVLAIGVEAFGGPTELGSYERLVSTISRPSDDPIFGEGGTEYATTYGLVLSAAIEAGDTTTAERARAWLDEDRLPGGWGASWDWDPFTDGTITPAGTPFAITTAIAVDALLDDGLDASAAREVGDVLLTWAREGWSDGSYWYSLAPQDAVFVPNSASFLAGVTARFVDAYGDEVLTPAEADELRGRVRSTFETIDAARQPGLRWSYSSRQPIVNDTGHHVYVLWGGERARDAGIDPGWTRDEAIASLDAYGPVYPPDIEQTRSMLRRDDSPWETQGTGAALAWSARWGGDLLRWSAALCEALEVTPRASRYDAHALLGMAAIGWCDCRQRQPLVPGPARSC